jgi:hypothetical protein
VGFLSLAHATDPPKPAPATKPAAAKPPPAPPPDDDLLEFLGSVDQGDDDWIDYLAQTDPATVAKTPKKEDEKK